MLLVDGAFGHRGFGPLPSVYEASPVRSKATHTAGGKLLGPPLIDFIRGTADAAAAE